MNLSDVIEVRCPNCSRLLFKVRGIAQVEIVCRRCGTKVLWPDLSVAVIVQIEDPATRKVLDRKRFTTSGSDHVPLVQRAE